MMRRICVFIVATLAVMLCVQKLALAHRMHVFAHVKGHEVVGNVTDDGNKPMGGTTIAAYAPNGTVLAEAVTDHHGEFVLEATTRCDWRIVASSHGHVAEHVVSAAELPHDLPAGTHLDAQHGRDHAINTKHDRSSSRTENANAHLAELNRQVVALRRDIAALRTKLRLQDITGGIGYILGLMGMGCLWLSRRRKQNTSGDGRTVS